MSTKFDARQSISRDLLDQLALVANKEVDDLLRSINKELTPPFQMHQDTGSNRVLKIENYTVTNPETLRKKSIPPISNTLPTGGTFPISLTFPASSGGTVLISGTAFSGAAPTLTVSVGNFIKVGINYDANGNITLTFGTENVTEAAATAPPTVDGMYAIGFVTLQNSAGTIQNVQNTYIYQYVGSGGSGGSGSGNTILETLKNDFVNSPYNLMSTDVISQDANVLVDPSSTATYSLVSKAMSFTAGGQTVVSVNMLDLQEFLGAGRDIWDTRAIVHWRLASLDTAATYEVSRDGGGHYATVSMSRIGSNTEVYYGDYRWAREEEDAASQTQATGTTDVTLTDTAGVIEAVGQKFTFASKTRGTSLRMSLKKTSAPTGSYRMAIYSDTGGTAPSSRLFATAWTLCSTLGTGYADITVSIDYQNFEAGVQYWLVLETDTTYKNGVTAAAGTISWARSTSGTNQIYTLDGITWTAIATATANYTVSGGTESFVTQVQDATVPNNGTAFTNSGAGTPVIKASEIFTLASPAAIKKVVFKVRKLGDTTGGMLYLSIVNDNAGSPSTDLTAIQCESAGIDIGAITGLTAAPGVDQTITVTMPTTVLPAGSYHLVWRTDDTYKTNATIGYSSGVRELQLRGNSATTPAGRRLDNAGVWQALGTPMGFAYVNSGRVLDLRLRVTSSASNRLLDAFTLLYDKELVGISGGVKNVQAFSFNSVTDNTNEFPLTTFSPDPDVMNVYHVERGKVYRFGVFSLQGSKIVFPANFFYNAGVSETVTLVCTQLEGSGFDNSDRNALLLANNFLGSTDATIDRSQPGRGIFLRRPDGTLRELALDDNDNPVVYSV